MAYSVKEIFYTLQGEGAMTGRPAVFCRFAGCNLWSGREEDRTNAICSFCDTDFVGTDGENGDKFQTAQSLANLVASLWPENGTGTPYVVCTGGEPLLQLDDDLIEAFHAVGFEIAVETNGTIKAPRGIDWICVSPKANAPLKQMKGNELKLVYPQTEHTPADFIDLEFDNFFLQPKDAVNLADNIKATVAYCMENPQWRLSLQTHKTLGIK